MAYVDASVLLRVALAQPDVLPEWSQIRRGVSIALVMAALLWKEMMGVELVMATHDGALALGAQAHGLPVLGVTRS